MRKKHVQKERKRECQRKNEFLFDSTCSCSQTFSIVFHFVTKRFNFFYRFIGRSPFYGREGDFTVNKVGICVFKAGASKRFAYSCSAIVAGHAFYFQRNFFGIHRSKLVVSERLFD